VENRHRAGAAEIRGGGEARRGRPCHGDASREKLPPIDRVSRRSLLLHDAAHDGPLGVVSDSTVGFAHDTAGVGKHRGFSGLGKIFGAVLDRFFWGP
jgi:hypothetical protein